jgi:hypothetical protein
VSDKYTSIQLPGLPSGAGYMDHGEVEPAALIARYRTIWEKYLEQAQAILAAKDEDFKIHVVRGVHVQHLVKEIQKGREL